MITAQPFGNDLYMGEVTGEDLLQIFEFSATPYFVGRSFININILQISGKYKINFCRTLIIRDSLLFEAKARFFDIISIIRRKSMYSVL